MKIKLGFISNSSTSSFIIAANKLEDAETTITLSLQIKLNLSDYGEAITNKEEFYKWLKREYDDDNHPKTKEILSALNNGKVVVIGSFSDQNEDEERILCNKGLKNVKFDKPVEVIFGEGGY